MHDTRHTAPKASAAGSIAQPWQVLHQGNFKVMESLTLYHGLLRLEVWKEQGQFWFLIKGTVKLRSKKPLPTLEAAKMHALRRATAVLEKLKVELELAIEATIPF